MAQGGTARKQRRDCALRPLFCAVFCAGCIERRADRRAEHRLKNARPSERLRYGGKESHDCGAGNSHVQKGNRPTARVPAFAVSFAPKTVATGRVGAHCEKVIFSQSGSAPLRETFMRPQTQQ